MHGQKPPNMGGQATSTSNDVFGDLLVDFTPASQSKPLNALRSAPAPSSSWSGSASPGGDLWDFDALDNGTIRRSMTSTPVERRNESGLSPVLAPPPQPTQPTAVLRPANVTPVAAPKPAQDPFAEFGFGNSTSSFSMGMGGTNLTLGQRAVSPSLASVPPPAKTADPWDLDFLANSASTDSKPKSNGNAAKEIAAIPSIAVIAAAPSNVSPTEVPRRTTPPVRSPGSPQLGAPSPAKREQNGNEPRSEFPRGSPSPTAKVSPPQAERPDPARALDLLVGEEDEEIGFTPYEDALSGRGMKLANNLMGFGQQLLGKAASNAVKALSSAASRTASLIPRTNTSEASDAGRRTPADYTTSSSRFKDSSDDDDHYEEEPPRFSGSRTATPTAPIPRASPPKKRHPPAPRVDPAVVEKVDNMRLEGNEKFKAGQYPEAIENYTAGISALPPGATQLLPLFNNRAAAYFKTGDYTACIKDCSDAQALQPGDTKSLSRRATAFEGLEKWKEAANDYEQLLVLQPGYSGASQGLARCRKAQGLAVTGWHSPVDVVSSKTPAAKTAAETTPASLAKAREEEEEEEEEEKDFAAMFDPHHARSAPSQPSTSRSTTAGATSDLSSALERLRMEDQAATLREAQQISVKDAVDSKIGAWLSKRESNIRALLASLDQVLWPELGVRNSAMSDLINPAQVKRHYLKAITRIHPDKIHPDESIERKMIASAVFTALNSAYDSFEK